MTGRVARLEELETAWSIVDVLDATEWMDANEDAQAEANAKARQR